MSVGIKLLLLPGISLNCIAWDKSGVSSLGISNAPVVLYLIVNSFSSSVGYLMTSCPHD